MKEKLELEENIELDKLRALKPSDVSETKRLTPSDSDVEKIYSAIDKTPYKTEYKRSFENCLITLLLRTGIRINEAFNIHMSDIDLENRTLFIRKAKGGKTRTVGLSQKIYEVLREFINKREELI